MDLPSASPESTLYPKITNHLVEIIKTLKYKLNPENNEDVILEPIPIVGTVKLHGTHADILIYGDNDIVLQSRNKPKLLATADNQGFAAAMAQKTSTILHLRNQLVSRWQQLHPNQNLDKGPITIAGEWIGEKIQKGVAIAQLSKRFVIISTKINGSWVTDTDYSDVEAPDHEIYNVCRGGVYHSTLFPEDPQRTMKELEPLADKIAARDPFAESFGVIGEGEGLVWKLVPYIHDSSLWFKTKGGKFKPTFTPAPKKSAGDNEGQQHEAAAAVAKAWTSEQRLAQGIEYLREKGIKRDMKGIGVFLRWMQTDILIEEKRYIVENEISESILRMEIIAIAKPWYLARLISGTD
jgi:hypothetical protein